MSRLLSHRNPVITNMQFFKSLWLWSFIIAEMNYSRDGIVIASDTDNTVSLSCTEDSGLLPTRLQAALLQ